MQTCEIIVSVDGAVQQSYEQYRVNGDLKLCLAFMRDVRTLFPSAFITWKYVLFEHNDSDHELSLAQSLAQSLNIDERRFINTRYGPYSTRLARIEHQPFPITSDKVNILSHPFIPNSIAALEAVMVNKR